MINLLQVLQMDRFKPRYYIAAATDNMSLQKARVLENSLLDKVDFVHMCFYSFSLYFFFLLFRSTKLPIFPRRQSA